MMTCAHCDADFRRYVIGDCPEEPGTCDCPWHEHTRKCDRIATLERQLAEARRERDALKAGKWAGPLIDGKRRNSEDGCASHVYQLGHNCGGSLGGPCRYHQCQKWTACSLEGVGYHDTREAAIAAMEAAFAANGWYLAPQPPEVKP